MDAPTEPARSPSPTPPLAWVAAAFAAVVGLALVAGAILGNSATYDEPTYLEVGARWWRTGESERMTRMGSPLTFWKLQQTPTLWLLTRSGLGGWMDDPIRHQPEMLRTARFGAAWIWLVAFVLIVGWARRAHGDRAMVMAAWAFALSPDLIAHGALVTMEMPLVAASAAAVWLFAETLRSGSRRAFVGAGLTCGLAFSLKFTAATFPPLLGLAAGLDARRSGRSWAGAARASIAATAGLGALLVVADLAVTGLATTAPTTRPGLAHPSLPGGPAGRILARLAETPLPSDWVGFAIQARHQRGGGPSYLLGEIRDRGWWYYYPVALAAKLPLAVLALFVARLVARRPATVDDRLAATFVVGFLILAAVGSTRNYGVRYLLPLAPAAIVWASALAEGGRRARLAAVAGVVGLAAATASAHPHELTFFNAIAGGTPGGRRILADSNLDWGQGLRALAQLQRERPEYRDLTLYYFGDTRPDLYGVSGRSIVVDAGRDQPGLPPRLVAETPYVAVSASLSHGPWGPPGYFRSVRSLRPIAETRDGSILIYRSADLDRPRSAPRAQARSSPAR